MPRWPKTTPEERFWDKIDVQGPDDCWPWTASLFGQGYPDGGYGQFSGFSEISRRAHIIAYVLEFGPIPEDDEGNKPRVHHRCENPVCCNPWHLELVDDSEHKSHHSKDRWDKGSFRDHNKWYDSMLKRTDNRRAKGRRDSR